MGIIRRNSHFRREAFFGRIDMSCNKAVKVSPYTGILRMSDVLSIHSVEMSEAVDRVTGASKVSLVVYSASVEARESVKISNTNIRIECS